MVDEKFQDYTKEDTDGHLDILSFDDGFATIDRILNDDNQPDERLPF